MQEWLKKQFEYVEATINGCPQWMKDLTTLKKAKVMDRIPKDHEWVKNKCVVCGVEIRWIIDASFDPEADEPIECYSKDGIKYQIQGIPCNSVYNQQQIKEVDSED